MNTLAKLLSVATCACIALACGTTGNETMREQTSPPAISPPADDERAALDDDVAPEEEYEPPQATWVIIPQEVSMPQDEAPAPVVATATLESARGDTVGQMTFSQTGDVVVLSGTFSGLLPGLRGLQIHTHGDCGGKGARRSGPDFNPTRAKHGPPESSQRHAGDFGNLDVDAEGNSTFVMETDSLTVTEGPASIVGRSIVVTRRKDNGKTQPSGKAGPAVACGVITLSEEQAPREISAN